MEQLAATRLKSSFRRHGSSSGVPQFHGNEEQPRENGRTIRDTINEHLDEHSRLLSRPFYNADGEPLYKDSRSWVRWPSETAHITYQVLASNYVNVLLVFVPLGIIAGAAGWSPTAIFVLNFLAIIPLAALLSFATEELSVKLGQTLGGLLNASFGNAVELIVSYHISQSVRQLLNPFSGQHSRAQEWGNSYCAVQYAWIYTFQYSSGFGLLLSCRWNYTS